MAKTNNIIKINGKLYDAITGEPLDGAPSVHGAEHSPASVLKTAVHSSGKQVMDVRRPSGVRSSTAKKRAPESSKTLMRQAVKKPAASFKHKTTAHTRTDVLARQPASVVLPKLSFHAVDPKREAHAQHIKQSKLVSRFGSVTTPEHAHLAPAKIAARPKLQAQVSAVATPLALSQSAPSPSPKPATDIFERALLKANSHEQPPVAPRSHRAGKKHRRLGSVSALSLAVLLVGGFLAYENMANLTMHVAASKAGFAATMPGYRPSGFSVGKLAYSTGHVTIHFHSNSDSLRSFAVIEQPSNWDSSTLLNNFVNSTAGHNYQTASAAGRTVYLYGNNNATWVSGGVWYRVTDQNSLSANQLISLASSM